MIVVELLLYFITIILIVIIIIIITAVVVMLLYLGLGTRGTAAPWRRFFRQENTKSSMSDWPACGADHVIYVYMHVCMCVGVERVKSQKLVRLDHCIECRVMCVNVIVLYPCFNSYSDIEASSNNLTEVVRRVARFIK